MTYNPNRKYPAEVNDSPRSLFEVTKELSKSAFNKALNLSNVKGAKMLRAQCKRLASQNYVIGNTVFSFDKDGIVCIPDMGRQSEDFKHLLRLNGVIDLDADKVVDYPAKTSKIEESDINDNEEGPSTLQDQSPQDASSDVRIEEKEAGVEGQEPDAEVKTEGLSKENDHGSSES